MYLEHSLKDPDNLREPLFSSLIRNCIDQWETSLYILFWKKTNMKKVICEGKMN